MNREISNEYVAGFFDGEGSVGINKELRPRATISQKKREILDLIQKKFGGKVCDKGKGSSCHQLIFTKTELTQNLLEAIYPYLIVKKDEVELVLKMIPLIRKENKGFHPMGIGERKERQELRDKLQEIRPSRMFTDVISKEKKRRLEIRKEQNDKCFECGIDLGEEVYRALINKDGKLRCRKCSCLKFGPNKLPRINISKERLEQVLKETKNTYIACKVLGISRGTLYSKRKKFGLPSGRIN